MRVNHIQETEFGVLTLGARRAAGKVHAQQRQFALGRVKAQLQIATLRIKLATVKPLNHVAGFMAGVNADTRIALFLRALEIAVQAGKLLKAAHEVAFLGFDFLHTHTIRAGFFKPVVQPFAAGRTNAVEVKTGECEQGIPYG